MRGDAERQSNIMLAVTPESFIPGNHPIRRIKPIVDAALQRLSPLFDAMYARRGRPSIPPEHLLKASLLIALYSIRSERQFCERLRYDLLFKWFLDLNISDEPFDASSFSKNRERLLAADVAHAFFAEVVAEAKRRRLLSAEHFTVDGTLLEAWASLKSYRPRDGQEPPQGGGRNPDVDFRRAAAQPRYACFCDRPGGAAVYERVGADGEAELHGPRPHGEPARPGGGRGVDRGRRVRRASGGDHDAGAQHEQARHAGRRPRLRHARLRGGAARSRRDAARGAQRPPPPQRHRRTDDTARRVRGEPAAAQAGGGGLRLAEDRGWRAQAALCGTGAQPLVDGARCRGLQPRAHRQTRTRPSVGAVRPPAAPGAVRGRRTAGQEAPTHPCLAGFTPPRPHSGPQGR